MTPITGHCIGCRHDFKIGPCGGCGATGDDPAPQRGSVDGGDSSVALRAALEKVLSGYVVSRGYAEVQVGDDDEDVERRADEIHGRNT